MALGSSAVSLLLLGLHKCDRALWLTWSTGFTQKPLMVALQYLSIYTLISAIRSPTVITVEYKQMSDDHKWRHKTNRMYGSNLLLEKSINTLWITSYRLLCTVCIIWQFNQSKSRANTFPWHFPSQSRRRPLECTGCDCLVDPQWHLFSQ